MQFDADLRYAAPPTAVARMLADPDFVDEKCERMHAQRHEVTVQGDPTRVFTVTTLRTLSTDGVPELVRPLVGRHVTVRQVDRWLKPDGDGNRDGYLTLQVAGLPITFDGRHTLRALADQAGTRQTISGVLRAGVPVVGPQIERLAEQAIRAAIGLEQRVGRAWLASRGQG